MIMPKFIFKQIQRVKNKTNILFLGVTFEDVPDLRNSKLLSY